MSKFLGPIHFWLYHKIQLQEGMTDAIVKYGKENNWNVLADSALSEDIKPVEMPQLDTVIDGGNIHGWLQARIGAAEDRSARLATAILDEDASRLDDLKKAAKAFGEENKAEVHDAQEAYQLLNDSLLDGMPCDNVNQLTEKSEDRVCWSRVQDMHAGSYQVLGKDDAPYYALREAMVSGMLEGSGYKYSDHDGSCVIKKVDVKLGMYAVDLMMEEHQNIHYMLQVVDRICCGILEGADVDADEIRRIIDFIRKYADRHHHGKEEDFLFPRMVKDLGTVAENLITHGMLVEHDLGRDHVREAEEALNLYEKEPKTEHKLQLIAHLMGYANLLQRHIEKENNVVYTFANNQLSEEAKEEVNQKCRDYERKPQSMITRELHLSFLKKMMEKYGVTKDD
jgi:hemerythrin-like domain-containing protein